MAGLGGVDELRRRAGRGEGRGDLAGDMAALADAGDDQPAARRRAEIESDAKGGVEGAGELFETVDLGANDPAGDRKIANETARLLAVRKATQ